MEKNLYHLSPEERRRLGIDQLPETLGEAIELTAQSELVLRTLGEHTFNRYVEIKRQEWDDYRVQVTPWELERYLPVLMSAGQLRPLRKCRLPAGARAPAVPSARRAAGAARPAARRLRCDGDVVDLVRVAVEVVVLDLVLRVPVLDVHRLDRSRKLGRWRAEIRIAV